MNPAGLSRALRASLMIVAALATGSLIPAVDATARIVDSALGPTAVVAGAPGSRAPGGRARPTQRGAVSLEEAVTIATEQVPGRVVKAETVKENGRDVHEVLIIQEGNRVRTVRVDPESGEIL